MKFQKAFSNKEMKILASISIEIFSPKRYPILKWIRNIEKSRNILIDANGKPEFAEDKFTEEEKDFLSNVYIICYYRIYPIIPKKPTADVKIIHLQKGEVFTLKDFWQDFIDWDIWYKGRFIEREFIPNELLQLFDEEMRKRKK